MLFNWTFAKIKHNSAQQTNKCEMRSLYTHTQPRTPLHKTITTAIAIATPHTQLNPPKSTGHCTHIDITIDIDNDKYMGIIKSWNLFLCAYNGGQSTHGPPQITPKYPPNRPRPGRPQETHFIWQYGKFYVPEKAGAGTEFAMPLQIRAATTTIVTSQNKQLWGRWRESQNRTRTRTENITRKPEPEWLSWSCPMHWPNRPSRIFEFRQFRLVFA